MDTCGFNHMSIEIIKSRTNGVRFWFLGERVLATASVILITELLTIKEPVFIRIIFHLLIQKTVNTCHHLDSIFGNNVFWTM